MSGNFEVCPIGTLQRLAAAEAECDALAEANEAFGKRQVWWDNKMLALEAERDVLRAALDAALEFAGVVAGGASWWDDVWPEHEAAIAKAEGEKT